MNKNAQGNLTSTRGSQDVRPCSPVPETLLLTSPYYCLLK